MDDETKVALLEIKAGVLEVRASVAEFREQQARTNADLVWRLEQITEGLKQLRDDYIQHSHPDSPSA